MRAAITDQANEIESIASKLRSAAWDIERKSDELGSLVSALTPMAARNIPDVLRKFASEDRECRSDIKDRILEMAKELDGLI